MTMETHGGSGASRLRVAVAMSGGVDSAVAALLLARAGHDVLGVTLKLFCYGDADEQATDRSCCSLDAIDDARASARAIGIRHVVLDFSEEFKSGVIDPFARDYLAGRTPSPCVACNSEVKFNRFLLRAMRLEADVIATGHYARVLPGPDGGPALYAGVDPAKDQSYFLWGIGREALERVLLPVGDLTKSEVRAMAREAGLPVADKRESMDICFVPQGDYGAFLERERGGAGEEVAALSAGAVVNSAGERLGTHQGTARFTVGQRKGLGVAAGRPLYVTSVDPATRTVVVGGDDELLAGGCEGESANLLADAPEGRPFRAAVRVRHRHAPVLAEVTPGPERRAVVRFDAPVRAVAPGQSIVFYDGPRVLGGAVISRAIPVR